MKRESQNDRLEAFFRANVGRWIPGYELARVMTGGPGVGTTPIRRIHELRHKRGMNIENRKEWSYGICHSDFRLVPAATQPNLL